MNNISCSKYCSSSIKLSGQFQLTPPCFRGNNVSVYIFPKCKSVANTPLVFFQNLSKGRKLAGIALMEKTNLNILELIVTKES